jgi:ligand-binding sensor domain-containing protein
VRGAVLGCLALAACGRLGFNAEATDAGAPPSVFTAYPLPAGGSVQGLARAADGTFYATLGDDATNVATSSNGGASWSACARPPMNDLRNLAVDSAGAVYLGSETEVLVSHDKCATWQPTGFLDDVHGLAFLGSPPQPVAGSKRHGVRIYDGSQWTSLSPMFDGTTVNDVAIQPDGSAIFVASDNGIFRSIDQGASFQQVYSANDAQYFALDPATTNRLLSQTLLGDSLLASSDGGGTWTPYGAPGYSMAFAPSADACVIQNAWSSAGIQLSGDYGQTWSGTDTRSAAMDVSITDAFVFADGGVYAATGRGVFFATFTQPGCVLGTWTERDVGLAGWPIVSIAVADNGTILLGTAAGVLRSTDDGATWTVESTGININSETVAIAQKPGDPNTIVVATAAGEIQVSPNQAATFAPPTWVAQAMDGYHLDDFVLTSSGIVAGTWEGVMLSDPGWTTFRSAQLDGVQHYGQRVLALDTAGTELLVGTDTGLYYSNNQGVTFSADNVGLDSLAALDILALAAAPGGGYLIGTAAGVYTASTAGGPWQATPITSVARDLLAENGKIIAATNNGVMVSADGGTTWSELPGLGLRWPYRLALDHTGKLIVGTNGYGAYWTVAP